MSKRKKIIDTSLLSTVLPATEVFTCTPGIRNIKTTECEMFNVDLPG